MRIFSSTYIFLLVILFSSVIVSLENCSATDTQQFIPLEKTTKEKIAGQVIFYSRTGNTRTVAEVIAATLNVPLQEIQDLKDRSGFFGFIGGMVDVRKNPITTISPETVNLDGYDLLFIGSPIWGMKFAPAITTFLQGTDFTGKKIILFATTSSRMKQTAFDEYSELIHTKGGTVIDTFFLKTFWEESNEIRKGAEEIVNARKEVWLEKSRIDEPE